MIELNRILCPTDLSTNLDQALRYALTLTRAYKSKLIICYRPASGEALSGSPPPVQSKELFENALHRFLGPEELREFDWQWLLLNGEDVGESIARAASEWGADLIVMRSRRRPHRAAILGSTAESVCRTAPCPVLVTHADERDWVQPVTWNMSLQKVLVPYDFSDHSELALKYALSLAQEYQAELHLLHVLPRYAVSEPEIEWYPARCGSGCQNALLRLRNVVPPEANLWCQVKTEVTEGHPYREILIYAEKNAIDLISIGAHGAGFGMRALFGSNVDRVLRQSPCPVFVARPLKPISFELRHELQAEMQAAV